MSASDAWTAYYRGVVRASLHRPLGRPPSMLATQLVERVEAEIGRPVSGSRDFAEHLVPLLLAGHDVRVTHVGEREVEYRWRGCPCADFPLEAGADTCAAGMQFHEAVARAVIPDLTEFRVLAHDAWAGDECRVVLRA